VRRAIVAFIALQFAHVPLLHTEWDVGVFAIAQSSSIVLLLYLLYQKVSFSWAGEKRCVMALMLWMWVSLVGNAWGCESLFYGVTDSSLVMYCIMQLSRRERVIQSDSITSRRAYYLLFPPRDWMGLALSTVWLPFGNRMVVCDGLVYRVAKNRFKRVALDEEWLNKSLVEGAVLIDTGKPYDYRLGNLTGGPATPIFYDCRQYEVIFGSARKLIRKRDRK